MLVVLQLHSHLAGCCVSLAVLSPPLLLLPTDVSDAIESSSSRSLAACCCLAVPGCCCAAFLVLPRVEGRPLFARVSRPGLSMAIRAMPVRQLTARRLLLQRWLRGPGPVLVVAAGSKGALLLRGEEEEEDRLGGPSKKNWGGRRALVPPAVWSWCGGKETCWCCSAMDGMGSNDSPRPVPEPSTASNKPQYDKHGGKEGGGQACQQAGRWVCLHRGPSGGVGLHYYYTHVVRRPRPGCPRSAAAAR